ncbi:MAG TPA: hypothetical protein DEP42_02285 [Ruminococcaceae bacterium]|nr:hypothetical protein [Oscillospiraceae bacterium]
MPTFSFRQNGQTKGQSGRLLLRQALSFEKGQQAEQTVCAPRTNHFLLPAHFIRTADTIYSPFFFVLSIYLDFSSRSPSLSNPIQKTRYKTEKQKEGKMKTQIEVAIVAHPARKNQAHILAKQVQAYTLCMDEARKGERWNHQQALQRLLATEADWLVVLEDDAIPCQHFEEKLSFCLSQAKNCLVSLYLGTGRWAGTTPQMQEPIVRHLVKRATRHQDSWIKAKALWHAVGFAVPRSYADSLLAFLQKDPSPTDQAATHWLKSQRIPCWYTYPSLLDHADTARLVVGNEKPVRRVAWWFADEERPDLSAI